MASGNGSRTLFWIRSILKASGFLELGCGSGRAGIGAALRSAHVVMTGRCWASVARCKIQCAPGQTSSFHSSARMAIRTTARSQVSIHYRFGYCLRSCVASNLRTMPSATFGSKGRSVFERTTATHGRSVSLLDHGRRFGDCKNTLSTWKITIALSVS